MANDGKVLNLSDVISVPVTNGLVKGAIWTGVVSSDKISSSLIPDYEKREEFKKIIQNFEANITKYRENTAGGTKTEIMKRKTENNALLRVISQQIIEIQKILNNPDSGINMDLFYFMLCQEYERILEENPDEFENMMESNRNELKRFYNIFSSRIMLFANSYLSENREFRVTPYITKRQEESLRKRNKGSEKLSLLVKTLLGEDNISKTDENEIINEIFESLDVTDLLLFIEDKEYAKLLCYNLYKNYLLRIGYDEDTIQGMENEEIEEIAQKTYDDDNNRVEYHKCLIASAIMGAIDFCEFDKLMLLVVARYLMNFENIEVGNEIAFNIHEVINCMRTKEVLIKTILGQPGLISNSTIIDLTHLSSTHKIIRKSTLKNMMKKYYDGIYLSDGMQKNFIYRVIKSPGEMKNWSSEFVRRIEFDDLDLVILSLLDFQNFKILYENGKFTEEKIELILGFIKDGSLEKMLETMQQDIDLEKNVPIIGENVGKFLGYLVSEGIISALKLKEFYYNGIIEIEDLEVLEKDRTQEEIEEFRRNIGENIDDTEVFIVYKEYIKSKLKYEHALEEDSPEIENFKIEMNEKRRNKDSVILLFSRYKLAMLSEEERNDYIEMFLLTYCLEMEHEDVSEISETLRQMYRDGIIKFEDISRVDEEYLKTVIIDLMFVRGELSLDDTRKLREILGLKQLVAIVNKAMTNTAISEAQKLCLIMNIFHNGAEDQKIADMFLGQLHAEEYVGIKYEDIEAILRKNKTKTKNKTKNKTDTSVEIESIKDSSTEWVYPKYIKWMFLNALDKDAIITPYANGYVEVRSKKLGGRIIEKYFEIDRETGNRFGRDAYGYSTLFIDESTYIGNYDKIVDSRSGLDLLINVRTLSALVDREDRVRHNTKSPTKNWMREMAKYFNIDLETDLDLVNDTRYSKEELAYLREIIITYENVYIDRNDDERWS